MQKRINFYVPGADQNLIALRVLLKANEAVRICQVTGKGSGDTADDFEALYHMACEIQKSLSRLIGSTIFFLENCSGQIQEADQSTVVEISHRT